MGNWFADVNHDDEESATKGPPPRRKRKTESEAKTVYRYTNVRELLIVCSLRTPSRKRINSWSWA